MLTKLPKILALVLAFVLSAACLSACGNGATPVDNTQTQTEATPEPPAPVEDEPVVEAEPVAQADAPLVIAEDYLNQKFSPFFAETVPDVRVMEMTQIGLMTLDRRADIVYNAIEGEKRVYNGEEYEYKGIADLSVDYDETADITTYRAKIRDDLTFSDGVPVTMDDLIFTYYVLLDPSYTGASTLYSYDIVGLEAYRNQLSDQFGEAVYALIEAGPDHEWTEADPWEKDLQDNFWAEVKATWISICQSIIDVCTSTYIGSFAEGDLGTFTTDEFATNEGLRVVGGMVLWGFGQVSEDNIFTSAVTGREWNMANGEFPTVEDYYTETYEAYGGDLDEFAGVEEPNGNGNQMAPITARYFKEMSRSSGGELTVKSIEGIRKINDYEVEILVNGFSAPAVYHILSSYIAPLHYYGDKALYDPENGTYGFEFGDLSKVEEKTTKPLGAGPYKFVEYSNGVVYMEANPTYWEGEPETKYVQFKELSPGEEATGIVAGTHDVADVDYSPANKKYIKENNDTGEITGDTLTTTQVLYLGYGYIGLSAYNVSVNNEGGSDASKNMRKALATVLAAYRDVACASYYEESATVINYPISNTSWAAPVPTDAGYEVAFSKDVSGNPIYTADMTADQKYAAAIEAALGYFEAAGYTVQDGKVVSGPADVRKTRAGDASYLEFECWVGADGSGDHPVFSIYTDFKEAMASIGITITIVDTAWNEFQAATKQGLADIWAMAWGATVDPDMYQVYHSSNIVGLPGSTASNMYCIDDPTLDQLIFDSRVIEDHDYRKSVFKQAFDIIMDWAVEVPNYQRNEFVSFSTPRVNTDTIAKATTPFYEWRREVDRLQMRAQ